MQIGAAAVESSMEIPQKIKKRSAFWPRYPTSGNISQRTQNTNSKEHKHPYAHCSIVYSRQDMEWYQAVILIFISLINGTEYLFMAIQSLYNFGEESVEICPFL